VAYLATWGHCPTAQQWLRVCDPDGIYASFEHGMIRLRAERTKGRHEIALEPSVYHALTEYASTIWAPGAQPALERIHAQAQIKPGWIEPA
jgi:hypothetical protein